MTFDRLHHMQLTMPRGQEQAARTFYTAALRMVEVDKPTALAARGGDWFRSGGVELHLGVEDDFRPSRKGHPRTLVTDLDDVVRRSRAQARTFVGTLTSPASGGSMPLTRSAIVWSSSNQRTGSGSPSGLPFGVRGAGW